MIIAISIQGNKAFLLDIPRLCSDSVKDKLNLYKLNADVNIKDKSDELAVIGFWGDYDERIKLDLLAKKAIIFADPRHKKLGVRAICLKDIADDFIQNNQLSPLKFKELRIDYVIPEGGVDFLYNNVNPYDINLDLLHAISFDKGCYVGQEVVARIHYQHAIRKRTLKISFNGNIIKGSYILADKEKIGVVGTVMEGKCLGILRTDRLKKALDNNLVVKSGDVELLFDKDNI